MRAVCFETEPFCPSLQQPPNPPHVVFMMHLCNSEARARLTHACARNFSESLDFPVGNHRKKSSRDRIFPKSRCAFDARTAQSMTYERSPARCSKSEWGGR